ncbi:hypothetical protein ACFYQQ_00935 [Streptomyces sp. NPDC005496]|uniref:hypothetical protein n=1 Tax=unclassified Streptomyces TaxID=2593676 RepID=UPI0033B60BD1
MSCTASARDVTAAVFLAVGLFGASLVPFFLLVNAEHLLPRAVRQAPAAGRAFAERAALTAAALLLILTAPTGATR